MTWGIVRRRTREAMLVACPCGPCGEVLKAACGGWDQGARRTFGCAFLGHFCSPRMSRAGPSQRIRPARVARGRADETRRVRERGRRMESGWRGRRVT